MFCFEGKFYGDCSKQIVFIYGGQEVCHVTMDVFSECGVEVEVVSCIYFWESRSPLALYLQVINVEISVWVVFCFLFCVGYGASTDNVVHVFIWNVEELFDGVLWVAVDVAYDGEWRVCGCWGSVGIWYGV